MVHSTNIMRMRRDTPAEKIATPFRKFLKYEATSGIILIATVIVALIWANVDNKGYYDFWHIYFTVSSGSFILSKPLTLWINDLLMAIFFLLVGLEVKREILIGELRNLKAAMLPITAAIGGILVPAGLYLAFNMSNPLNTKGWAIPAATDIAFALGVLYLLGNRVPMTARVFLASLAIIDDIAAILIIAVFYSGSIKFNYLVLALVMFLLLVGLNLLNVRRILPYMLIGAVMWYGFFGSGIHATIAGVILAMTIPATVKIDFVEFRDKSKLLIQNLTDATIDKEFSAKELSIYMDTIAKLEHNCQEVESPLQRLEHSLAPWVTFTVMPIFALANAGVKFSANSIDAISHPVSLGIILGLAIGKPLGIFLASYIALQSGFAKLPTGLTWNHILGLGFLAGIGFTMSTFIATLAFELNPIVLSVSKIAILIASFIAGISGYILLRRTNGAKKK